MDIFDVSKLGFGTSQIGGPSLIMGEITGARPIPKNEAISILKYAYENGINFFDTSDKYGNAEDLLGEAFSKMRDKVVIATKCGLTSARPKDFSISYIKSCVENSLRRLKTDYIDIFQLTKPNVGEVTDGLLSFFEKRIKQGKIRYLGISVTGTNDGRVYLSKEAVKSFQIFYNLLFTESHELITECAKNNRFVIVRSPLNSGMLSGRYTMNTRFDTVDFRSKIFHGKLLKERLECVEKIKGRFNLSGEEVLTFSLNFVFSNGNVNVAIPAASNVEQLGHYIHVFNKIRRFDEGELKEILEFAQKGLYLEKEGQLR